MPKALGPRWTSISDRTLGGNCCGRRYIVPFAAAAVAKVVIAVDILGDLLRGSGLVAQGSMVTLMAFTEPVREVGKGTTLRMTLVVQIHQLHSSSETT